MRSTNFRTLCVRPSNRMSKPLQCRERNFNETKGLMIKGHAVLQKALLHQGMKSASGHALPQAYESPFSLCGTRDLPT